MARGTRGKGSKAKKKPARGRKPAKRAKASARKPAKRRAAKTKPSRARATAKATPKRAAAKKPRAKKAAPLKPPKLQIDMIEVETIEEFVPGVAVVSDYEIIGVHPVADRKKDDEPGSQSS